MAEAIWFQLWNNTLSILDFFTWTPSPWIILGRFLLLTPCKQFGYDLCRPSSLLFVVMLKWYWCWKNIKVHFIFYCFTELFSMCYSLLINKEFYVNVNQTFHFFDQRLIFAFPCFFDAIFKCRLIGTSQVLSLLNKVFLVKKKWEIKQPAQLDVNNPNKFLLNWWFYNILKSLRLSLISLFSKLIAILYMVWTISEFWTMRKISRMLIIIHLCRMYIEIRCCYRRNANLDFPFPY